MRDQKKVSIVITICILTTAVLGAVLSSCSDDDPTVVETNPPALVISEDRLSYASPTSDRDVTIWNGGQGTLEWEAVNSRPWLSISPDKGVSTGTTDPSWMVVVVDWDQFEPGETKSTSIEILSNGGQRAVTVWASEPAGPCSITITSPITHQLLTVGETHEIQWTSENTGGYVRLALFKAGEYMCDITEWAADNGRFRWEVDDCGGGDGTDYRIRITDLGNYDCRHTTADFDIQTTP